MRLLYFPPFLGALGLIVGLIVYRLMDRATRPPLVILGLRWFLGAIFVFSGLAKLIHGFPNTMGPADLENTLAPYGLAAYARFIAVSEVGVGLVLLTRRFATLGALCLAPMLINILVITTSQHWRGTPYVVSGFLAMDLALLIYDRRRLSPLILDRTDVPSTQIDPDVRSHLSWLLLLAALLVALGAVRVERAGATSMLIVAALVLSLVILDWRQARRGS